MLRSFWRPIDRFSLQHFRYIINELQGIEVVHTFNRETVVDILQTTVEKFTYGDRHDPSIFECFMEHQVLAEFIRMLKISRDTNNRLEAKVLQYLSIMIQNLHSEHAFGCQYFFCHLSVSTSCLLQVVVKKDMLDSVASLNLNPHVALGLMIGTEDYAVDSTQVKPSSDQLNSIKKFLNSSLESQYDDEEFGVILGPKLSAHWFNKFSVGQ